MSESREGRQGQVSPFPWSHDLILINSGIFLSQKNIFDSLDTPKLEHKEIADYVKSLKKMAKYWYDTYFPEQSQHLDDEGKLWVDRLNRVGMGYFRPLVMAIISRRDFQKNSEPVYFRQ